MEPGIKRGVCHRGQNKRAQFKYAVMGSALFSLSLLLSAGSAPAAEELSAPANSPGNHAIFSAYTYAAIGLAAVVFETILIAALLLHRRRHRRVEAELRMSEERYRDVVESQSEMVCRYLPDTTLTFVNEAYCRYFEKSKEELIGRKFLKFIPPDTHAAVIETVKKLIESRAPIAMEHEVLRPDGSIGWMQWEDRAIFDERDRVEELQGIGRDITGRRLTEEALRQSEEKFARAFRASPSAISINRASSGEIVDVNESWEELFKIERSRAVGRTPLELKLFLSPEDGERLWLTLEGENSLRNHEIGICTNGEAVRWASISCEPIPLEGKPCYISIIDDLTERKRIEEARQNLAHSMRLALLGELTASIAHEVNQPLGAILSNAEAAEILLEESPPALDEVRQILADIRRDDVRASEVIRHIRALVGKRDTQALPMDLNEIVTEVVRLVSVEAQRRRVTLLCDLAVALPKVHGDRVQIEQVLINLIVNGMDAMAESAPQRRKITVRTALDGVRWLEVSVRDEGHGFPSERLPRIFESFFTTKENGMGLGLALARSIAEAHRGRITAENNADSGATFRLYLPVGGTQRINGN